MPVDSKYGRVTLEHGTVGADEPVIVFRAQDQLVPKLLGIYWNLCKAAGSPQRHLDMISRRIDEIAAWQDGHATKVPDSETSRAWMP